MRFAGAIALLLAAGAPGAAQVANPLAMTTDPADRAVMAEAASAVSARPPDIARLDAVLAKLPRPTPLRGMVQTVRAGVLGDPGRAVAAVEEAMRLLPDDPRPKLVATSLYTFGGSPQRAADLWMQASRESPDIARMSQRYLMVALAGRLRDIGDDARADRLAVRLVEIGFANGLAPERSGAALARTRDAVRGQAMDDALQNVTAVGDPDDLFGLYIDRRYAMLWPRIAQWAGDDLADQSRRYLEELRGDWSAADDFDTAAAYARRLAALGAYPAVAALFVPMFDRVTPQSGPDGAEFLVPVVARALARLGRAGEARALLDRVAAAMPADDGGSGLNIEGAYLTLAGLDADWPQVLARADGFIARAEKLGSYVNRSAVVEVRAWRACALWRSGRTDEAQRASAEVALAEAIQPGSMMRVHLCHGDAAAARALAIARLGEEGTRGWGLRFVQPPADDAGTPYDRLVRSVAQAVRADPGVVAAANRVGRILPQALMVALPAGFDPFRARPQRRSSPPDAI